MYTWPASFSPFWVTSPFITWSDITSFVVDRFITPSSLLSIIPWPCKFNRSQLRRCKYSCQPLTFCPLVYINSCRTREPVYLYETEIVSQNLRENGQKCCKTLHFGPLNQERLNVIVLTLLSWYLLRWFTRSGRTNINTIKWTLNAKFLHVQQVVGKILYITWLKICLTAQTGNTISWLLSVYLTKTCNSAKSLQHLQQSSEFNQQFTVANTSWSLRTNHGNILLLGSGS